MQYRLVLVGFLALAVPVTAHANLLTNGSFETFTTNSNVPNGTVNPNFQFSAGTSGAGTTNGTGSSVYTGGAPSGYAGSLAGWSTANSNTANSNGNYMLLFNYADATTSNAYNQYGNASGNLLPSGFGTTSPDGTKAFVALDGDTNVNGYLVQQVGGLTVGSSYDLSFYWAAAQLLSGSASSNLTEKLVAALTTAAPTSTTASEASRAQGLTTSGNNSYYTTNTVSFAPNTATGWVQVTTTFVATAATEYLSFLSVGTPSGGPPVALLDGVTLNAHTVNSSPVPEPATWVLMLSGLGVVGLLARRRTNGRSVIA